MSAADKKQSNNAILDSIEKNTSTSIVDTILHLIIGVPLIILLTISMILYNIITFPINKLKKKEK